MVVGQTLADHPGDDALHLVDGIRVAGIVATGEFIDVPVQVLDAELVKDAFVRPFEGGPMGLDSVGMRHVTDVLSGAVVDRLMRPVHADIRSAFIRVDLRCWYGVALHRHGQ